MYISVVDNHWRMDFGHWCAGERFWWFVGDNIFLGIPEEEKIVSVKFNTE